ncbi:hypothetical protein [Glutamicibacter arilaitensis]|uniref:hypothetical protein n=1 Tax=Glutamicibacter arilaitensis TaxID=256701 RepID=UPI003FD56616
MRLERAQADHPGGGQQRAGQQVGFRLRAGVGDRGQCARGAHQEQVRNEQPAKIGAALGSKGGRGPVRCRLQRGVAAQRGNPIRAEPAANLRHAVLPPWSARERYEGGRKAATQCHAFVFPQE